MEFERQGKPSTSVSLSAQSRRCAKPIPVSQLNSISKLKLTVQVARIDAVQSEYSAFETLHESSGVIATCKELGVVYVAYSPLGHGWLVDDFDYKSPDDFAPDDFRRTCQ